VAEDELPELISRNGVEQVVLAYSDLSYEEVMHKASIVLAAGADFRALDAAGRTPLHLAAAWGMEANVLALLKAGASVRSRDAGLQTPLHQARTLAVVQALVQAGAPRTWRDRNGNSPEQALRAAGETEGADYLRSL